MKRLNNPQRCFLGINLFVNTTILIHFNRPQIFSIISKPLSNSMEFVLRFDGNDFNNFKNTIGERLY